MPSIMVSNQKGNFPLFYRETNTTGKPVVLLLHGLGATGESWQLQTPELVKAGMRVVAPDLPGFGESGHPDGGILIRSMAESMATLLHKVVDDPVIVVGISMGGVVALQLALGHPQLIRKLVLVNTFARLTPDSLNGWVYLLRRYVMLNMQGISAQADYVAKRIFPKPEQEVPRATLKQEILQSDPKVYRGAMRALGFYNVVGRLKELSLPVLVVSGENDTTVPLKNQYYLAEHIKGAQHVLIPEAGHAVIADQPERFNQVLLDYLLCTS